MPEKKLYRSTQDRMIAGVCGGIAEYFDIDSTLVRLIAIILVLANGVGLVLYIAAWLIMPENPAKPKKAKKAAKKTTSKAKKEVAPSAPTRSRGSLYLGFALVALGVFILFDKFIVTIPWHFIWPSALILAGIVLLLKKK